MELLGKLDAAVSDNYLGRYDYTECNRLGVMNSVFLPTRFYSNEAI